MRQVLIANRGEIALRIARACRAAGLGCVAVHSTADDASPHVWAADRAVRIGPAAARDSYLAIDRLLHVAKATGCDAVHPGYGFLAENADFARRCMEEGLIFIGPEAAVIALMGDKAAARREAGRLGLPLVPGSEGAHDDAAAAAEAAEVVGFPLLIKARAGGGGRGMRVCRKRDEFAAAFAQAHAEAEAAFGDGALFLERFLERVRHVEVQVFADQHGTVTHFGERDCTIQRRHQKLVEEAPCPVLDARTRTELCEAAETLARGIDYLGAGTVEFLLQPEDKTFYFIEMNTRIQVEHPVTEMVAGVDLVRLQLAVAAGAPLPGGGPPPCRGHAMEFRLNAEDPQAGFRPTPGVVTRWDPPAGPRVRLDSHVHRGYAVPPHYDSLLGKLIVHGTDRGAAIETASRALASFAVEGVATTLQFHRTLLACPEFLENRVHTRWVEETFHA